MNRLLSPLSPKRLFTTMSSFAPPPSTSRRIVRPVPPQHPGMTVLDRSVFELKLTTLATRIPASKTGQVKSLKILKGYFLSEYVS
jgi:hypothetical protein